jgi:hypothetical protein
MISNSNAFNAYGTRPQLRLGDFLYLVMIEVNVGKRTLSTFQGMINNNDDDPLMDSIYAVVQSRI